MALLDGKYRYSYLLLSDGKCASDGDEHSCAHPKAGASTLPGGGHAFGFRLCPLSRPWDRPRETMGRGPTLTGRTQIWHLVLSMTTNPLLGTGFESFWLGPRLQKIWS